MQQRGFDTLHQDMVHDAQFDFYGKRLATCSSDSLVKVWQVDAGDQYTQTGEIAMHEGPVWQVSWSHPQFGSLLATCGYDKRVMVFREASPGNWVRVFCYEGHLSSVNGLSWAPPELGLHLATASSDGKVVVLSHRESDDGWDVAALEDSTLGTLAVSWAPAVGGGAGGARFLATAGCDGSVNVWGCEGGGGGGKWSKRGGALKCCPSGEAVWVRDVAWCPMEGVAGGSGEEGAGGNAASAGAGAAGAGATPPLLLAAATDAGVVHLFRTKGGGGPGPLEWEAPITLPKFNATVWRVSWSATGRLLAVSSGDNTVTLWKEDVSRTWQQVCNAPVNSQ